MAYSEEEKARALIRLAENRNDYHRTAKEIGCSVMSLRNWERNNSRQKSTKTFVQKKEDDLTVADYLEQAIKYMLKNPPTELKGDAWAITVGVLMDKWLLSNNQATERKEIVSSLLEGVSDDEYDNILREAERIIEDASRRDYPGNGKAAGY